MDDLENGRRGAQSEVVHGLFRQFSHVYGDAPAIAHLPSGRALNYRQLYAAATQSAVCLAEFGARPRDKVAILTNNETLFFPLLGACSMRRAAMVPISPDLHRDEIALIIEQARPKLIVVDKGAPLPPFVPNATIVHVDEFWSSIEAQIIAPVADAGESGNDIVLRSYSLGGAGKTGQAKAMTFSQQNLAAAAIAAAAVCDFRPSDRVIGVRPLAHPNPILMTGLAPLAAGAQVLLADIRDIFGGPHRARRLWSTIVEQDISVCSFVPVILRLLLDAYADEAPPKAARLRHIFCGAGHLPPGLWRQFEERFGIPVYQGYGLAETAMWSTFTPPDRPRNYDSVGVPLNCEIRIAQDPRSNSPNVRGRQFGEILIRGPVALAGYGNDKKRIKTAFTADGFLRTGDIGSIDENGHVYAYGRIRETIVRSGVRVNPFEVDSVLAQCAAVRETKTIGVPHEILGEEIVTVCLPGGPADGRLRESLAAWARERLPPDRTPDRIVVMPYLPRNSAGEVSTGVLRRIVSGELCAEMLDRLAKPKYQRFPPSDREELRAYLQNRLLSGAPIELLNYWGCGNRPTLAQVDLRALERLEEMRHELALVPNVPVNLTLLLTDVHARLNGKPEATREMYFAAIRTAAEKLGFRVDWLGDAWRRDGIDVENSFRAIDDDAFAAMWNDLPIREQLLVQAEKHFQGEDIRRGAQAYYWACQQDRRILTERYSGHIFITYNMPPLDACLPDLLRLYIYPHTRRKSDKPWFDSDSAPDLPKATIVAELTP
ncbi:MAG: acyl--CoA ligase [Rhodospirillales bacterium]|nr:acyl--CoA ligase [Rhodospirillales bacterium]